MDQINNFMLVGTLEPQDLVMTCDGVCFVKFEKIKNGKPVPERELKYPKSFFNLFAISDNILEFFSLFF